MENELIKYLFEMDSLLTQLELAQENMNSILETLNQWTKDHIKINNILWCPVDCIYDVCKAMKAEQEAIWEKVRAAK